MTQPQLKMNWPLSRLSDLPNVCLPDGYLIRQCQTTDETDFVALMHACGWEDWGDERLAYCKSRLIPKGWFLIIDPSTEKLVASAMSLHNYSGKLPYSGTLGWVGCAPEHRGQGLGACVVAAATRLLLERCYEDVELYTEYFRTAALRSYLRLGYVPYLYSEEVTAVWEDVCKELSWPFMPESWPAGDDAFPTISNS